MCLFRWHRATFVRRMQQQGAFCAGTVHFGLPQAAAGCFSAGAGPGATFVRHSNGSCLCRRQRLGAFLWFCASFVRHSNGSCLARCAAHEQRAPGPRPLHSPALRQPHSPLRGPFTRSVFLTDRRRFAPAQRRLSRHPCRSPWKPSLVQRVGMALHKPRCKP